MHEGRVTDNGYVTRHTSIWLANSKNLGKIHELRRVTLPGLSWFCFSAHDAPTSRKNFSPCAKHSPGLTRLYGCGRFWGCISLRQKKPRGGSRGAFDTHIFPAVSPEILLSCWQIYSHQCGVSTVFRRHPLGSSLNLSEREPAAVYSWKGDTHEARFCFTHCGAVRCTSNGSAGFCKAVY